MMCEICKKDGLKNLHGLNIDIANKHKDHPKSSDERQHDRLAKNRKERPGYCDGAGGETSKSSPAKHKESTKQSRKTEEPRERPSSSAPKSTKQSRKTEEPRERPSSSAPKSTKQSRKTEEPRERPSSSAPKSTKQSRKTEEPRERPSSSAPKSTKQSSKTEEPRERPSSSAPSKK
eukprot:XP_011418956.1 PREDICTED: hepatoma-derived growth factor-related protein 2-like [Crassostrea gigas]